MARSPNSAKYIFTLAWPLAFAWILLWQPIPQEKSFFDFAESGQLLSVPHAWNVWTNFAFLWVGFLGIKRMASLRLENHLGAETVFYVGIFLTGLGSAYFHWNPNMDTLLWDRLPMTVGFMAFYCSMIQRSLQIKIPIYGLIFALLVGAWSVLHWASTEAAGAGDLRFYIVVQFLPMVLLPILFVGWPSQKMKPLWCMLGLYAIAKVCEHFDHEIASWLPFQMTGHALKHLFAASGAACFLLASPRKIPPTKSTG